MSEHITQLILNSSQRTSGTPQNPTWVLRNPGIRMDAYEVHRVNISHSFYNITQNNNVIYWTDDTSTAQVSTLTVGNYSIDELLMHIGDVMTADTLADTGTASYSATKNTNSNKITITNNLLANFSIEWSTDAVSKQLACDLGFFPTPHIEDRNKPDPIDLTGDSAYTANNAYWVGRPRTINIKSNLAQMGIRPACNSVLKDGGLFNILTQVLVPTVSGEIITYNADYRVKVPVSGNMIFEITMELLDEQFKQLDLNGIDWQIILLCHNLR